MESKDYKALKDLVDLWEKNAKHIQDEPKQIADTYDIAAKIHHMANQLHGTIDHLAGIKK